MSKNIKVYWQELLKAKICIYIGREQWPTYLWHRSASAGNKSDKELKLAYLI